MNIRQKLNQASTVPARAGGRPVIVDFTPVHDWRADEEGSAVLVLALPGFTREQVKVTAEPLGNIRVRGLRHVGNRNWSRFNSEFRVPEDCSMTGIRAKFENGYLHITIPKKNPLQSKIPKEEPRVTSAQSDPPQPLSPSKPLESQLAQPSRLQPQPPLPPPVPQSEQIQPQPPQLPPLPPPVPHFRLPDPQMVADYPKDESQKMPPRIHDEAPSERHFPANREDELKEWETPESLAEMILKGGIDKRKEPPASVGTAEEMEQLRKEHLDNRARETEALIGARLSSELKVEDYIKMARGKLSDERQTLINMGAAVLVIAGLGVYICCNIGGKINT
ncbi:unnamed protein product [Rhodiola kirilowii]